MPSLSTLNGAHKALNISCNEIKVAVMHMVSDGFHLHSYLMATLEMENKQVQGFDICVLNTTNQTLQDAFDKHKVFERRALQPLKDWLYYPIQYVVKGTQSKLEVSQT